MLRKREVTAWLVLVGLVVLIAVLSARFPLDAAKKEDKAMSSASRFNDAGELIRPTDYHTWVFVGAPVTPNDMNDGQAAFPEFHHVYIDPVSFKHWKRTGKFRDGAVLVKDLIGVETKHAASGNGYFPGDLIGLAIVVKDKDRYPDRPGNWAFFDFSSDEAGKVVADAASPAPVNSCHPCHKAGRQDYIFVQHYPVLEMYKGKAAR